MNESAEGTLPISTEPETESREALGEVIVESNAERPQPGDHLHDQTVDEVRDELEYQAHRTSLDPDNDTTSPV